MNSINDLPNTIPIFPYQILVFPNTSAPLNIFEPRYIQMIDESIKSNDDRYGSTKNLTNPKARTFTVGCLGKISSFNETDDGRYILMLNGITRFNIEKEIENGKLFREFKINLKI